MKVCGLEVQDGGYQHNPIQVHSMPVLQIAGEPGSPGGAITFADEELGGSPALVACGVQADKITHRLDILLEAMKLLWFFTRDCPAETRAHRVDKHQVGLVEQ